MSTPPWIELLEISRNGVTERTIFGALAVDDGTTLQTADGANPQIFGRSLMKPFQMKAVAQELSHVLTDEEKALALSSHNGTHEHVKVAQQILPPDHWSLLRLPESRPMDGGSADKSIWFNPCSGKHSAILRACQVAGWPTADYLSVRHPYNARFVETIEAVIGEGRLRERTVAPDGCLLPTYALSMSELAQLFRNLAVSREDDWIWGAYHTHPVLIGGEGRLDTLILERLPDVLAKEGADGLLGLAFASPRFPKGLGVVIKLAHGYDANMLWHLAHGVLDILGYGTKVPEPPPLVGQTRTFSQPFENLFRK